MISRHQGQLNLSPIEFQRMMNIVHLLGLNRAKESYKDTNLCYRYDTVICSYNDKRSELTLSQTPELLLLEIVKVVE